VSTEVGGLPIFFGNFASHISQCVGDNSEVF
jgi:hypothetical protein